MLETISKTYSDLKEKANPRKKFAFSQKKTNLSNGSTVDSITSQNSVNSINSPKIEPDLNSLVDNTNKDDYIVKDQKDQIIYIKNEDLIGKNNVIIENLNKCELFLLHSFKACYLKNLTDCKIYVGSIAGGTHITNLNNCEVNLATHQLRIHTTHNCKFSVKVMSNPIIEDCTNLTFQDLNIKYDGVEKIYEVSYTFL